MWITAILPYSIRHLPSRLQPSTIDAIPMEHASLSLFLFLSPSSPPLCYYSNADCFRPIDTLLCKRDRSYPINNAKIPPPFRSEDHEDSIIDYPE